MVDEPENLTIRILQEIRDEIRDMRTEIGGVGEKLTDLTQRVDGNTLILNLVAGVVHDHEVRITTVENR